jgi:surface polysaccharide O-acyltransferase-like enzyme
MAARASFPDRDISLDLVRVVACVMVVLIHVASPIAAAPASQAEFYLANTIDACSRVAVPLFVVITGALLLQRPIEDLPTFYRKAWRRLVVPFLAWSLIYIAIQYLQLLKVPFLPPSDGSVFQPIRNTVRGGAYYHLWYLYMLVGLYLALPLLERAWRLSSDRERAGIVVGSAALALLNTGYMHVTGTHAWTGVIFLNFLPYFFLGGLLARRASGIPGAVALLGYAVATALNLAATGFAGSVSAAPYLDDYLNITTFAGAIFLFIFLRSKPAPRLGRASRFLADNSFFIYLAHPLFLALAEAALPDLGGAIRMAAFFPIALGASAALAFVVSRTPLSPILAASRAALGPSPASAADGSRPSRQR